MKYAHVRTEQDSQGGIGEIGGVGLHIWMGARVGGDFPAQHASL